MRGNADVMKDISTRLGALEGARTKKYIAGVQQIRADFGDFLEGNKANLDLVVLFMAGNGYIAEDQGTRAMAVSIAEKPGESLESGIAFLERWDTPSEISPFRVKRYEAMRADNTSNYHELAGALREAAALSGNDARTGLDTMRMFHQEYDPFLEGEAIEVEELVHAMVSLMTLDQLSGSIAMRSEKLMKRQDGRAKDHPWVGKYLNRLKLKSDYRWADAEAFLELARYWTEDSVDQIEEMAEAARNG